MTISDTDLANATTAWGEGIISLSQAYEAHGITQAKRLRVRFWRGCMALSLALSCSNLP